MQHIENNQAFHSTPNDHWLHFVGRSGSKEPVELGIIVMPDFPEKLWRYLKAQCSEWQVVDMVCPF